MKSKGMNRIERPEFKDKQQVEAPFLHYLHLYEAMDAAEIAARTGLPYTSGGADGGGCFALTLVGTPYSVNHPEFLVVESSDGVNSGGCVNSDSCVNPGGGVESNGCVRSGCGAEPEKSNILRNPYEEILLIHYLTEGVFVPPAGELIDYRQFPGGSLYHSKFKQRAIDRLAREFGANPGLLAETANRVPGLRIQLPTGSETSGASTESSTLRTSSSSTSGASGADACVTVEFLPELWVTLLVWAADDEFPASAQILFSDNFPKAFTAEDTAGVCDILISRLKKHIK
jgi:hypothetical protein